MTVSFDIEADLLDLEVLDVIRSIEENTICTLDLLDLEVLDESAKTS